MDKEVLDFYRMAGRITAETLGIARRRVADGYPLLELAEEMEGYMRSRGAFPAFPVNISIDDAAAHFTPASDCDIVFRRGQIAKIDCGACYSGYIGDSAITIEVGSNSSVALVNSSKRALEVAIKEAKGGISAGDLGEVIEREINALGFQPIENLSGHEVSEYDLHAGISIPNIADSGTPEIEEGMVIAVEPFATEGRGYVIERENGNIYQFVGEKNVHNDGARSLMHAIKGSRALSSLPFCERWCMSMASGLGLNDQEMKKALKMLEKSRVIWNYPVLREATGSLVSQWEHTLYIKEEGCEVLTSQ